MAQVITPITGTVEKDGVLQFELPVEGSDAVFPVAWRLNSGVANLQAQLDRFGLRVFLRDGQFRSKPFGQTQEVFEVDFEAAGGKHSTELLIVSDGIVKVSRSQVSKAQFYGIVGNKSFLIVERAVTAPFDFEAERRQLILEFSLSYDLATQVMLVAGPVAVEIFGGLLDVIKNVLMLDQARLRRDLEIAVERWFGSSSNGMLKAQQKLKALGWAVEFDNTAAAAFRVLWIISALQELPGKEEWAVRDLPKVERELVTA